MHSAEDNDPEPYQERRTAHDSSTLLDIDSLQYSLRDQDTGSKTLLLYHLDAPIRNKASPVRPDQENTSDDKTGHESLHVSSHIIS